MIAIVILGLLACASTAPSHGEDDHHNAHSNDKIEIIREKIPQYKIKWSVDNEYIGQSTEKEYIIILTLQGSVNKEFLKVTAKKEELVMEDTRKAAGDVPIHYVFKIPSLPDYVGENYTWTYERNLLKIVFPIIQSKKGTPMETMDPQSLVQEEKIIKPILVKWGNNKD